MESKKEGGQKECDAQEFSFNQCFWPIRMFASNSLFCQLANEKTHLEREKHSLLAGHRAQNI